MNAREKLVDPGHRSKNEKENATAPVMNLTMVEDPELRPPTFLNKFGN